MRVEIACLGAKVSELRECMPLTSGKIKDLKTQLAARLADTYVVVERLDRIDREVIRVRIAD